MAHDGEAVDDVEGSEIALMEQDQGIGMKESLIAGIFWNTLDLRMMVLHQLDQPELAVMIRLERSAVATVAAVLYRRVHVSRASKMSHISTVSFGGQTGYDLESLLIFLSLEERYIVMLFVSSIEVPFPWPFT
jgi:hypothetical protein